MTLTCDQAIFVVVVFGGGKKNEKQKNRLIAGYDDPGCLAA